MIIFGGVVGDLEVKKNEKNMQKLRFVCSLSFGQMYQCKQNNKMSYTM